MLALIDGVPFSVRSGALKEETVGSDHVVDDATLADLPAPDMAVTVAEMVVGGD